jgi:iron complex outermembrane receptor protein
LATGFAFSQDCNLKLEGNVVGIHDNTPLEAAVIQVVGTPTATISAADGRFVIENLCPGKLTLKISHLNCEELTKEVDIRKSALYDFFLDHHVESLEEVVIATQKTDRLSSTAKVYAVTEAQKDRYSAKGLADVLEGISGVNILATGNSIGKPVIHGMFGSRVGIVYDGLMLENQQWGQDHAPNVDLNAFENIRVIKGAATLKYSGAKPGGMVILESTLPKPVDSLYGKTILSRMTNGKGTSIVSSWVKSYQNGTFIKAQGTLKRNGDFSAPDYVLTNTGSNEKNLSFSLGKNTFHNKWKLYFSYFDNEVGILKSAHIGNVSDLLRAIEAGTPNVILPFSYDINNPKQANKHYTTSLEYSKYFEGNRKLNIKYSWQKNNRKEYDIRRGDFKNIAALDLHLNTHDLTTNFEWFSDIGMFDTGVFAQIQDNFSNPDTGVKRLIPDYLKVKAGGYATASFRPNETFTYGLGLRYEYQNNTVQKFYTNRLWAVKNYEATLRPYVIKEFPSKSQKLVKREVVFNTIALNAGAKYTLSSSYVVGLNYNYAQRAPDIAEMFSDGLHHSLATIEYGNPFLEKEKTHKIMLDVEKKEGDLTYSLSPFFTYGQNYIIIEPTGVEQTIRGAFPVWEYKAVNALLKGVDFDFACTFNQHIQLKHSTSWVHGTNTDTKTPLINISPVTLTNQIQFSLPKWKSFFVTVNSQNVLRQRRFPDTNPTVSVFEDGKKVDKIVDISTPPSGYHNLGIDLNWGSYALFSSKVDIALTFDNILNTRYRDYLNRLRFYSHEVGRNIMLQVKITH